MESDVDHYIAVTLQMICFKFLYGLTTNKLKGNLVDLEPC